jgi:hypothetical protein
MPVTPKVTGTSAAELRYLAGKMRKAAARDLTRVLKRAQRDAVKPLEKEIKAEAEATLPKRGGYNTVMAKAVKVSASGGTSGKPLIVRIYARGKGEERDVRRVNDGELRHPLFGKRSYRAAITREKKSGWFTTNVRPGFVDRPVDKLADEVLKKSAHEVEDLLVEIARK